MMRTPCRYSVVVVLRRGLDVLTHLVPEPAAGVAAVTVVPADILGTGGGAVMRGAVRLVAALAAVLGGLLTVGVALTAVLAVLTVSAVQLAHILTGPRGADDPVRVTNETHAGDAVRVTLGAVPVVTLAVMQTVLVVPPAAGRLLSLLAALRSAGRHVHAGHAGSRDDGRRRQRGRGKTDRGGGSRPEQPGGDLQHVVFPL
jgi:hypothetical protein